MHIDQETLQRFMHGELSEDLDSMARKHLATCGECRARFETEIREEEEIYNALHLLDHPVPQVSAPELMREPAPAPPKRRNRKLRRAATIILLLGAAGAAWAVPGSPVPGWIDVVIERAPGLFASIRDMVTQRFSNDTTATEDAGPDPSGLGMPPGRSLTVQFENASVPGTVVISLFDGDEVMASAVDGMASFTADGNRLVIANPPDTRRYEIRIPRDARRVEVRVGSQRIFFKDGSNVTAAAVQSASGAWVLSLGSEDANEPL